MSGKAITMRERFAGCLLGLAVGDAMGAPLEGMPADIVYRTFGPIRNIIAHPPVEELTYTDDTQMMIGVAEALVQSGEIVESDLAKQFGENFESWRGYGPGTRRILEAIRSGRDWEWLAANQLPGGSFGNGAAMRVAPVGLLFWRDEQRLIEQAVYSARPTHTHPLGIEGAVLLALAIRFVLHHATFFRAGLFSYLSQHAASEEFADVLSDAARLGPEDTLGRLGNTLEAHRSVVTSIACFALNMDSYEDTIARAISLGGDVDTLAAMAGAISGARLGVGAIPRHLVDRLENGPKGRDYILGLADALWKRADEGRS